MAAKHGDRIAAVDDGDAFDPSMFDSRVGDVERKMRFRIYDDGGPTNDFIGDVGSGDENDIFRLSKADQGFDLDERTGPVKIKAAFFDRIVKPAPKRTELPDPGLLAALGVAMASGEDPDGHDSGIPAGYSYLGQFIAHDLSRLWVPENSRPQNQKTAMLDLDSVFGVADSHNAPSISTTQKIGELSIGEVHDRFSELPRFEDLPRAGTGEAVVPDSRNDAHVALSQTHVAVIKFYQSLVAEFQNKEGIDPKRLTIQHFQHLVLRDYLKRIIDGNTYADVMNCGRRIVNPKTFEEGDLFYLPIEFMAACFRFGHSMVRQSYPGWSACQSKPGAGAFLENSFNGNGLSGHKLNATWINDWLRLLDFSGTELEAAQSGRRPLMAGLIDTRLAEDLGRIEIKHLPVTGEKGVWPVRNLAARTLMRSHALRIPSGQALLRHVNLILVADGREKIDTLSYDELIQAESAFVQQCFNEINGQLKRNTPLWFYILKESSLSGRRYGDGKRLGPLAGRIVMETIHAAIEADPHSILRIPDYEKHSPIKFGDFPSFIERSLSGELPQFKCQPALDNRN